MTTAERQERHRQELEKQSRCRLEIKPYKHQKPTFKLLERMAVDDPKSFDRAAEAVLTPKKRGE
jgi:hypothetical protein